MSNQFRTFPSDARSPMSRAKKKEAQRGAKPLSGSDLGGPAGSNEPVPGESGYSLGGIYASRLWFAAGEPSPDLPTGSDNEGVRVGWDWRVVDGRDFEVKLEFSTEPSQARPDLVHVALVGRFSLNGQGRALDFKQFVQFAAPTILYPYLREAVSEITSRGPHGVLQLEPANLAEGFKVMDPLKTIGAKQLAADENLAVQYGWGGG